MRSTDLIRDVHGGEMPTPGCWRVPPSHVGVTYRAGGWWPRARGGRAPLASGALDVSERRGGSALTLVIAALDGRSDDGPSLAALLGDDRLAMITLRAGALEPTRSGVWRAVGATEIAGVWRPATVTVRYRGVYRAGDTARAWLTVRATVQRAARGPLAPKRVHLEADVLAVTPEQPDVPCGPLMAAAA